MKSMDTAADARSRVQVWSAHITIRDRRTPFHDSLAGARGWRNGVDLWHPRDWSSPSALSSSIHQGATNSSTFDVSPCTVAIDSKSINAGGSTAADVLALSKDWKPILVLPVGDYPNSIDVHRPLQPPQHLALLQQEPRVDTLRGFNGHPDAAVDTLVIVFEPPPEAHPSVHVTLRFYSTRDKLWLIAQLEHMVAIGAERQRSARLQVAARRALEKQQQQQRVEDSNACPDRCGGGAAVQRPLRLPPPTATTPAAAGVVGSSTTEQRLHGTSNLLTAAFSLSKRDEPHRVSMHVPAGGPSSMREPNDPVPPLPDGGVEELPEDSDLEELVPPDILFVHGTPSSPNSSARSSSSKSSYSQYQERQYQERQKRRHSPHASPRVLPHHNQRVGVSPSGWSSVQGHTLEDLYKRLVADHNRNDSTRVVSYRSEATDRMATEPFSQRDAMPHAFVDKKHIASSSSGSGSLSSLTTSSVPISMRRGDMAIRRRDGGEEDRGVADHNCNDAPFLDQLLDTFAAERRAQRVAPAPRQPVEDRIPAVASNSDGPQSQRVAEYHHHRTNAAPNSTCRSDMFPGNMDPADGPSVRAAATAASPTTVAASDGVAELHNPIAASLVADPSLIALQQRQRRNITCRWCQRRHTTLEHERSCSLKPVPCPVCGDVFEQGIMRAHLLRSTECRVGASMAAAASRFGGTGGAPRDPRVAKAEVLLRFMDVYRRDGAGQGGGCDPSSLIMANAWEDHPDEALEMDPRPWQRGMVNRLQQRTHHHVDPAAEHSRRHSWRQQRHLDLPRGSSEDRTEEEETNQSNCGDHHRLLESPFEMDGMYRNGGVRNGGLLHHPHSRRQQQPSEWWSSVEADGGQQQQQQRLKLVDNNGPVGELGDDIDPSVGTLGEGEEEIAPSSFRRPPPPAHYDGSNARRSTIAPSAVVTRDNSETAGGAIAVPDGDGGADQHSSTAARRPLQPESSGGGDVVSPAPVDNNDRVATAAKVTCNTNNNNVSNELAEIEELDSPPTSPSDVSSVMVDEPVSAAVTTVVPPPEAGVDPQPPIAPLLRGGGAVENDRQRVETSAGPQSRQQERPISAVGGGGGGGRGLLSRIGSFFRGGGVSVPTPAEMPVAFFANDNGNNSSRRVPQQAATAAGGHRHALTTTHNRNNTASTSATVGGEIQWSQRQPQAQVPIRFVGHPSHRPRHEAMRPAPLRMHHEDDGGQPYHHLHAAASGAYHPHGDSRRVVAAAAPPHNDMTMVTRRDAHEERRRLRDQQQQQQLQPHPTSSASRLSRAGGTVGRRLETVQPTNRQQLQSRPSMRSSRHGGGGGGVADNTFEWDDDDGSRQGRGGGSSRSGAGLSSTTSRRGSKAAKRANGVSSHALLPGRRRDSMASSSPPHARGDGGGGGCRWCGALDRMHDDANCGQRKMKCKKCGQLALFRDKDRHRAVCPARHLP